MYRVPLNTSIIPVRHAVDGFKTRAAAVVKLCSSWNPTAYHLRRRNNAKSLPFSLSMSLIHQPSSYSLLYTNTSKIHTSTLMYAKHTPENDLYGFSKTDDFKSTHDAEDEGPVSVLAEMIVKEQYPIEEDKSATDEAIRKLYQNIEDLGSLLDSGSNVDLSTNGQQSFGAVNSPNDDEESDWNESDSDLDCDDLDSEEYIMHGSKSLEDFVDPSVPTSNTPCAGCGALLHCNDHQKPGFMPSRKYKEIPRKKLREYTCLRCRQLAMHKGALDISVSPEEYIKIIKKMKRLMALCVLVVDVTDFPNSMINNLPELIGKNRPLYIVGNKVDLLPRDSKGYLHRVKLMIKNYIRQEGLADKLNIKYLSLISAKNGYGIEELVTRLMAEWEKRGDVYLLGTTNSGKSTLFNSLLSSDYCKDSARDYIHRATTSTWPGTTLNLLKFPIINPTPWRLEQRMKRLMKDRSSEVEETMLRKKKFEATKDLKFATLIGNVGQTFVGVKTKAIEEAASQYAGYISATYSYKPGAVTEVSGGRKAAYDKLAKLANVADYSEELFRDANWCYDTPGVVNPNQVSNLLNPEELSVVFGQDLVNVPRSYVIKPGQVLFLSGLGRLDYVQGNTSVYLTVISSKKLPVHVIDYSVADDFYRENICTQILKVPMRSQDKLNKLPSLIGKELHFKGIGWDESAVDVQLSSLGWVSVAAGTGMEVSMRAYTPGGRGCVVRTPSLLPFTVRLRGPRVGRSPAYKVKVKTKAF